MLPTAEHLSRVRLPALSVWPLLGALLLLPACTPLYAPNAVNAPLFKKQGEVQAEGHLGSNGAGVQAAAALTNHLSVMANVSAYRFDDRRQALEEQKDFRRHTFGEGALGYFGSFDFENFDASPLRYEVYAGYGQGRSEAIDHTHLIVVPEVLKKVVEGRFERFFVQASAGAGRQMFDGWIEGGVSLRAVQVRFYEFKRMGTPNAEPQDRRGFFLESAVSLRVGSPNIQLEWQSGFSLPLQDATSRGFDVQPFFSSVGVRVEFNVLR